MCGVLAIIKKTENFSHALLLNALDSMKHRGPDFSGNINEKDFFIGHNRLSIRELSSNSNQPKLSICKKYLISYNGELYNLNQLKKNLVNTNTFIKNWNSDTELLINYISIFGIEKTLTDIEGMFAFIAIDLKNKFIYAARDKFGEKPLYFYSCDNSFIFSSDLIAIKKLIPNLDLDLKSLDMFLKMGYILAPRSIYKNVNKLEPGSYLKIGQFDENKISKIFFKYYHIGKNINEINTSNKNYTKKELEKSLFDSVESQLVSDVEIGTFLSGGIDSSLITSIASKINPKIETFTIGFEEKNFDESVHAKKISEYLNIKNFCFTLKSNDLLDVVDNLSDIYTEPFADSSQIPTSILSNFASKRIKVALTGDGGDEMFLGYNRYIFYKKYKHLLFCNNFIKNYFFNPILKILFLNDQDKFLKIKKKILDIKDVKTYYKSMIMEISEDINIVKNLNRSKLYDDENFEFNNDFNYMQFLDLKYYLADDLLVKTDRASMYNSLETRAPFLNKKILEIAFNLDLKEKISYFDGKLVLKKILNEYLPKSLYERPKKGFGVPISKWFKSDLNNWIREIVNSNYLNHILDNKFYIQSLNNHLSGKADNSQILWRYTIFYQWYSKNR